jgi:hypothetical protein
MKQHRMSQVAGLMKLCMEEVAPNVRNCFGARWPALMHIHPEKGGFTDAEQFGSLMTEMRNVFDVLKSNLSKSGTQESGEILDGTALEFCKYHQRLRNSIIFTFGSVGKIRTSTSCPIAYFRVLLLVATLLRSHM